MRDSAMPRIHTGDGLVPVDQAQTLVPQSLQTAPALAQLSLSCDQVCPVISRVCRGRLALLLYLSFSPTIFRWWIPSVTWPIFCRR